jgi:hypothetical protein
MHQFLMRLPISHCAHHIFSLVLNCSSMYHFGFASRCREDLATPRPFHSSLTVRQTIKVTTCTLLRCNDGMKLPSICQNNVGVHRRHIQVIDERNPIQFCSSTKGLKPGDNFLTHFIETYDLIRRKRRLLLYGKLQCFVKRILKII